MIITIDGPSGTGKSTVTRLLAERLGFIYVDTGAMYRSVTYGILKHTIPLNDSQRIQELLDHLDFEVRLSENRQRFFFEKEEVTEKIREECISAHVSAVAALPAVRAKLVELQRGLAGTNNLIFEGRDMGTEVFPNAELKIFLTARPEVRAQRRLDELLQKKKDVVTLKSVLENINKRDALDSSREHSPLRPASDAQIIDTSDLSIDAVIERLVSLYQLKRSGTGR